LNLNQIEKKTYFFGWAMKMAMKFFSVCKNCLDRVGRERTPTTIQNGRFFTCHIFSFVLRIFFFLFFLHLFGERRIKMVGGKNVKSWGDLHFRERDTHKKTYNKRLERKKKEKTQLKGRLA
jgi:hypothetical protein